MMTSTDSPPLPPLGSASPEELLDYHRVLNQRSIEFMTPLSLLRIPQTDRVDGYDARLAPAPPFFYFETEEENYDVLDLKRQKVAEDAAAIENLLNIGDNPRHPRQWQHKSLVIRSAKPSESLPPAPTSPQPERPQDSSAAQPPETKTKSKIPSGTLSPKTERTPPAKRKASQMVEKKKALWKTTTLLDQRLPGPKKCTTFLPIGYPKTGAPKTVAASA